MTAAPASPVPPLSANAAASVSPAAGVDGAPGPASPPPDVPVMQVIFGLMLAILLGALEQSIVAVVLPDIALRLNGFSLMAWVISAYLIASTVATPIYGKLSDVLGRRS